MRESYYTVRKAYCINETDKALFLYFYDLKLKVWIPRSQLKPQTTVKTKGDRGFVAIGLKYASKKQILKYFLTNTPFFNTRRAICQSLEPRAPR